jgi:hypothetical protein
VRVVAGKIVSRWVTYWAAIECAAQGDTDPTPSAFAQRAQRESRRRGFDRTKRQAVPGDGAPHIWNPADEHFPDAIQIVDRFQTLSTVGKAIHGTGNPILEPWGKRRCDELDEGRLYELLNALRRHEQARKCVDYILRNRHRMRYPEFHALGLGASSGVVEAGCKVVVETRLKRAGMHWSVRGANAIIDIRCCILGGRFEDFRERRAEKRTAA